MYQVTCNSPTSLPSPVTPSAAGRRGVKCEPRTKASTGAPCHAGIRSTGSAALGFQSRGLSSNWIPESPPGSQPPAREQSQQGITEPSEPGLVSWLTNHSISHVQEKLLQMWKDNCWQQPGEPLPLFSHDTQRRRMLRRSQDD